MRTPTSPLADWVLAGVTLMLTGGLILSIWLDVPEGSLAVIAGLLGATIPYWIRKGGVNPVPTATDE